jgi:hypothetical protein
MRFTHAPRSPEQRSHFARRRIEYSVGFFARQRFAAQRLIGQGFEIN